MRVNRNKIYIDRTSQDNDEYVNLPPSERISFIWELTAELWSLRKSHHVKRRLQRNVTNIIKQ